MSTPIFFFFLPASLHTSVPLEQDTFLQSLQLPQIRTPIEINLGHLTYDPLFHYRYGASYFYITLNQRYDNPDTCPHIQIDAVKGLVDSFFQKLYLGSGVNSANRYD